MMKQKKSIIWLVLSVLLIALLANPGILPLSPASKESLRELEKTHLLIQGSGKVTIAHFLTALMAMLLVAAVYLVIKLILDAIGTRSEHSRTVTTMISSLLHYLAWIVAIVWGLTILGVNALTVLAGIGILGLILGFGAQSLIEDIITGFFIIFEGQYGIGDIIILDDFRGTVRSIGVRTTVIEDAGGNLKIVNNSDIRNLQNRSRNDSIALCEISVAYGTDLYELDDILNENLPHIYEMHKDLFVECPKYLGVDSFADSGINLKVIAKCREQDVFAAKRMLNKEVKMLFDRTGIEIPFPQVVLHQGE